VNKRTTPPNAFFQRIRDFAASSGAAFFGAVFFVTAGFSGSAAAALPAAESLRFGFESSGVAFDGGLERFMGGFFAVPEDACKLTAAFARVTAAFASRSSSRMWGALAEDRSVTFNINASILASRLRTLFAFMTTSSHLRLVDCSNEYRQ
jgi:hypothetical protein